jgi:VanZ family protein
MVSPRDFSARVLLRRWTPLLLWALLIFFFSTDTFSSTNTAGVFEPLLRGIFPQLATSDIPRLHAAIRKLGHFTEYFIFARLLLRALRSDVGPLTLRAYALTILVTTLYAAGDEFHQTFVPSRTASVFDVLIDAFAGICATLSARCQRL